ncbi:CHC2 zinc finger domain-containing protein [Aquimarina sp. 2201CG1-2-11]|uniref:CHC2 zinc finger domain-containing protein n=1 Tax=Aquimarina discodermiae TaxID=3231043 RepID=UPI00346383CA
MEITEIKQQLSIVAVLEHYNIKIGKNKQCLCPFHDDKTPSLKIYPETNTYHCFGCGATGDVIQFIEDHEKITKHKAIIKAKGLIDVIGHTVAPVKPSQPKTAKVYGKAFKKLQQSLHRSKRAIAYLQERNIYDTKLEIGYKPKGTTAEIKGMNNCIVFPLKDAENNIVSLYGRSLTKGHYYLENRQGLYPQYPTTATKTLILTESVIDATTLLKYTDYEVLALYGVNGLTSEHSEALSQLPSLKELIFFLDGDTAGRNATDKYAKQLHEIVPKVTISKVDTPDDEDVNSLTISHEPEILNHLIENREVIFLVDSIDTQKVNTLKLDVTNPDYLTLVNGVLKITVLGGINLLVADKLKVTLRIERTDKQNPLYHIRQSNLDLYNDEQLEKFIRKVAERLELGTREVQHTLYTLINELEKYRLHHMQVNAPEVVSTRTLSAIRKEKAINFLKSQNLLQRTNDLIGKSGVIGEENNRLLMYLVFTSRLREQPLHIISLGASGTGKTYLQEKISQLIPEEHKLEITALSENALYYFDRTELKNKLVLIEDLDGAQDDKILYAIRELMSKKSISKTIPIKDAKGNLKTITLKVEGPITLAGTTTKEKIYEDNANRSLLIYLDNSKEHKKAIMTYQRRASAGEINHTEEKNTVEFLKDVQSMLEKVKVRNPYATKLNIPETVFKPLRTNTHYLSFIETVTFYNQYQRERKKDSQSGSDFIETTLEDIAAANSLLKDVLLAKSDELTKGCRDFLERLKTHLQQQNKQTFYSSEIRKSFRMSPNNVKYYLANLSKYHLVRVIGGHPRKQGYEYEIIDTDDYNHLKDSINALDTVLQTLKIAG